MNTYVWVSVFLVLAWLPQNVQAQRLKEWFSQGKTQKEYLMQQIGALRVYVEYAQKGYEIYDKGLRAVGHLKNGEFKLHHDYFDALKTVNPEIGRYTRVADIIRMQHNILQTCQTTLRYARNHRFIRAEELDYISGVHVRLLQDCGLLLEELITLTTSGHLQMEDDERLQRIDNLYQEMQANAQFSLQFSKETLQFSKARETAQMQIQTLKEIYNLDQ